MKLKKTKEAKVKRLLGYFGSFDKIRAASIVELESAVGKKDASQTYEFYRGGK